MIPVIVMTTSRSELHLERGKRERERHRPKLVRVRPVPPYRKFKAFTN